MLKLALATSLVLAATPALALDLESRDVSTGAAFPLQFVCPDQGGRSISPQLAWSDAPTATKSFALTMFDPDAPRGGFLHWAVVDIPATTTALAQDAGATGASPGGGSAYPNGAGHAFYDGPCPPAGPAHHYRITVYAMPGAHAGIPPDTGPAGVTNWLKTHALASAGIVPVFERK